MWHKQFIGTRQEFIKEFAPFILTITKGTGILPGTLAAMAILESSGKTQGGWFVGGSGLSRKGNNFFGIKCHGWKGEHIKMDTAEWNQDTGQYEESACFRKYPTVEESIKDYVHFLLNNERYKKAGVFDAKTVKTQAQRLQQAGYATSPNYAELVNSVYQNIKTTLDSAKTKNKSYYPFIAMGLLALFLIFEHEK